MCPEPTTERLTMHAQYSSDEEYVISLIHIATYKYALQFTEGKKVLDYGCGTGYGTAMVSKHCLSVTGIDVAPAAISAAKDAHSADNLTFLTVNKAEHAHLPFADATFDVVLSFQVIEHVRDVPAYLQEINRVLAPGGLLLLATPDRSSRLFPFQKPWNMWHLREYSDKDLCQTLAQYFLNVEVKKIGGAKDLLKVELRRTRNLKWMTLPFTLPFMPEALRVACLRYIKYLRYLLSSPQRVPLQPAFDESAVRISGNEEPSVDLLAMALTQTVHRAP